MAKTKTLTFHGFGGSWWAVLSDEQMSKGWPSCLSNKEKISNKLGVEHQPVKLKRLISNRDLVAITGGVGTSLKGYLFETCMNCYGC